MNTPPGLYIGAQRFVAGRLTLARESMGLTMSELGKRVQVSASAISQYEKGDTHPRPETLRRLCFALGVPPAFFCLDDPPSVSTETCHFRKLRSATRSEQRQVLARGMSLIEIATLLSEYVDFPAEALSSLITPDRTIQTGVDIEKFADHVRDVWKLGRGPISDVTKLLETRGVLVLEVDGHSERLDAFSTWVDGWPVVFLSTQKGSASRRRFDAAHELGHLMIHPKAEPGSQILEAQANRFAGALLIPRESFLRECPRRIVWAHLLEMKRRWKVSLQAILYRAKDLGVYSEATFYRAFSRLSKRGWRKREPEEPQLEQPALLRRALETLIDAGYSVEAVANLLGRHPVHIEEILHPTDPWELQLF